MRTKQLTIRLTNDFHKALVDYCTANMIPVSTFMVQQTAKAIGYKPRPATTRTYQYSADDFGMTLEAEDDWDMADLQRRAAAAPRRDV